MSDGLLPFDPKKLARTQDPGTSHEAAASSKELRSRHHKIILEVFGPGSRLASEQVADRAGLTHWQVTRRMNELERAGRLEKTEEKHVNRSGRKANRYERTSNTEDRGAH